MSGLAESTQMRAMPERRRERLLQLALLIVDILALAVALRAAAFIRQGIDEILPLAALGWPERHVAVSFLAVPVLIGLFWRLGCYQVQDCLSGTRDYAQIAHGVTYGVILALALSYFSGSEPLVSRSWLVLVWVLSIVSVCLGRFMFRRVVRYMRRRGALHTRVVIVGASNLGISLAEQFRDSTSEGIHVVGFLDEYLPLGETLVPGMAVIGRPADLLRNRFSGSVDEFILVPQALPHERLEEITRLMISRDGPIVRMAVSSRDLLTHGVLVTERSHVPLVTLQRARLSGIDMVLKRSLDIVGASIALVITAPITLVALIVAAARGQRSLLEHTRVAAPGGGATRLWLLPRGVSGRLPIRGAPALLAVLTGHLSLVGPRPLPVLEGEDLSALGQPVTSLPPGLTGPWRLSGPDATVEQQALQDLAYVRNYSIWEDVRILVQSARPGALLGRWQAFPSGLPPTHRYSRSMSGLALVPGRLADANDSLAAD